MPGFSALSPEIRGVPIALLGETVNRSDEASCMTGLCLSYDDTVQSTFEPRQPVQMRDIGRTYRSEVCGVPIG